MKNAIERKKEAIERMKTLELSKNVIREFENDILYLSENRGYLYYLDERQQRAVNEFASEHEHITPYHIIHSITEFGELLSVLVVSGYEEEWEMDREDLKDGYVFAYVINLNIPLFSEFGSIVVRPSIGGLVRMG